MDFLPIVCGAAPMKDKNRLVQVEKMRLFRFGRRIAMVIAAGLGMGVAAGNAPAVRNGDFEGGSDNHGIPLHWQAYGETVLPTEKNYCYSMLKPDGDKNHALFIKDHNEQAETGIAMTIPAREKYRYTLRLDAKTDRQEQGGGAFMQIRFLPSQQIYYQEIAAGDGQYRLNELTGIAPDGTEAVTIYLYTHRPARPEIVVDNVQLSGAPTVAAAAYQTFRRDLCLETDLVKDGKPALTVIVPASGEFDRQAAAIIRAVEEKTGVELPIRNDATGFGEDTSSLSENLLLLGNRNNNRYISSLYDRHYVILDRCYPGEGGSVVRSLHNPFADGHNVIFAGGSDPAGTAQAVDRLLAAIRALPGTGQQLKIGRLADIVLGKKRTVPAGAKDAVLTEASPLYGNFGYFGWNSLSKNMALYYLTGEEKFAREFLRLAFPDQAAQQYLEDVDKEMAENKQDPIGGPYHYGAMMMILYWDLIEESPVFTDADREKIVAAFFRQLEYWERGAYQIFSRTQPAPQIGDRHAQWEALSAFALCRYIDCHYPTPQTRKGLQCVRNFFAPLETNSVSVEDNGSLFWYNTSIAPMFYYTLLSGNRNPAVLNSLARLAAGQTILVNGNDNDWATGFAANEFMLKTAYLLDDRRFVDIARQTGFQPDRLMLGQSFLPERPYSRDSLAEKAGKWNFIHPTDDADQSGLAPEKRFVFGSYRSEVGNGGDFLLLDGSYEWGRNLYHCLALLELRLGGVPLLAGHHNQVYVYNDGMYAARFPKFTKLCKADTLGNNCWFQGEIPDYNGYRLTRTIWLEKNRFAIFADTIEAVRPEKNAAAEIVWEFAEDTQARLKPGSEIELYQDEIKNRPVRWQLTAAEMSPLLSGPREGSVYMRLRQAILIRTKELGERCRLDFSVDKDYSGELILHLLGSDDRAGLQIILDGEPVAGVFRHCAEGNTDQQISLGTAGLKAGKHTLELVAAESSKLQPEKYLIAVKKLALYGPAAAMSESPVYRLSSGGAIPVELRKYSGDNSYQTTGNCAAMKLCRTFVPGETRTVFTVLAAADAASGPISAPYRSGLVARLPETAIIEKTGGRTISLLRADAFAAMNWEKSAGLGHSSVPVDLSWHFANGELEIKCPRDTEIELAVDRPAAVKADRPCHLERMPNRIRLKLAAGDYRLTGIHPETGALARIKSELAQAEKNLDSVAADPCEAAQQTERAPLLPAAWQIQCVNQQVSNIGPFPAPAGTAAVAVGNNLYLIAPDGQKEEIGMAAPIGAMHWWDARKLLLIGCKDDKVIALNTNRRRQWEFTSEMAPEVAKTGKFYWYKSPEFFPGVWGISSGLFLDGKEQAFIGSACTLEIIDGDGKLLKRMAQYWGPLSMFALIPLPDGSLTLAAGRAYSGGPSFGVVNNRTPDTVGYDFHRIPQGSDTVNGFTIINNTAVSCTDLDGDGKPEVVAAQNGAWNRIVVYDVKGNPLDQANLGPGEKPITAYPSSPIGTRKNINDVVIADFSPAPRQIVVALSRKTLLGLDHRCQCRWSRELDAEPVLLAAGAKKLFAACRNGDILQLDADGKIVRQGKVAGRPTAMGTVGGNLLVGSDQGEITAFDLTKD